MKTCFLLTHMPDPKTNKRIKIFKKFGPASVVCTKRKSQDIWEPFFCDVKYYSYHVDLPAAQHIFKRAAVSSRYQKIALKKLKKLDPDVIYADGLDSLLIVSKYKKKRKTVLFYDVADLREPYIEEPDNCIKKLMFNVIKAVEKHCFKNVDYLVITSPKFYSRYYYKLIQKQNVIYLPNAPEPEVFKNYKKKDGGDFTIGFIGGIRYLDQMKMLADAAGECGYRVLFAGAGGTDADFRKISEYCKGKDNISFTGKYNYEKDIAALYGKADCIYAVYDADNPNVRIALPNKLYEAVFCELPLIAAKNTYLSELTQAWGTGVSVGHKNKQELIEALKRLESDKDLVYKIQKNCKKIKSSVLSEKYENKLIKILRGIRSETENTSFR